MAHRHTENSRDIPKKSGADLMGILLLAAIGACTFFIPDFKDLSGWGEVVPRIPGAIFLGIAFLGGIHHLRR
ncbi:hypothetical protein A3H89_04505 [Candidatus Amesbacteria bacterium RIFCSPLOWO2_02_FULL_48_11]|uniref:Uncharacterized protein n=3 Tax=Candidatus Amesiibacteriota TaxID=1752730 RepID=A0A1F4Z7I9_9BACT|nr:MAG: hypothetical protein UY33_C0003G0011 [Candidatus Amesbacteria bacterium GW2011_GWA1_48_9]OGC90030.1 MAG: hypothetical protein A2V48_01320 [Candidatus Amesbacteria bacterium RBG_19FT_COMBO_48_16]OGC97255.1 MAG: hypothetical protein A3C34_04420 [Candidatus Amesbacteria bacterium RIFCSPHIGHO2_02_FULL_48_21]OGC99198.1 MAG: hypothetical protein A2702_01530 [Candidatus Amesbacteria bacterium RIFCSPHIGHO2_01_FULL_48_75]OGC99272.1 MAG: hypothetical protein A2W16_02640 [Candidatus Amesbacteria b